MKSVLSFFQYIYLVFAVLFAYDAITNWSIDRSRAYLSLFLTALAIFVFFFRKRFYNKFDNKD